MKKIIIIIVLAMSCLPVLAQDPAYKGAAKMDVTTFWRQIEIFKNGKGGSSNYTNLEKALASTRQKDPSYNTASMEAEMKVWKDKVNQENAEQVTKANQQQANMDAARNGSLSDIKLKKLLDELFNIGSFSFPNLETAQAENDAYKLKAQELLAKRSELDTYIANMKKSNEYSRFTDKMKISLDRNFNTTIERIERILAQSTGAGSNWKNAYYEMQAEQIHWDAAQKAFPDEPKFAEAYQKITRVVNKYGSLDNISSKNKENNAEKIKNTKLPSAVVKDPALEKMFVDAFNKRYATEYKGTATKAIMLQSDWQTERNELTGVVTGRIRQGAVVYKGNDGKCYLVSIMHLHQEYIGSAFQNTEASYAQNGQEMLCENVK